MAAARDRRRYEQAVYADDCDSICRAILDACDEAGHIPDRRVRAAIVSAAMLSAAQTLDGNDMAGESLVLKAGGIAAGLASLIRGCSKN
jgi:hypothetical protein